MTTTKCIGTYIKKSYDNMGDKTSLYSHLHTLLQYWEDCGDTVKVQYTT